MFSRKKIAAVTTLLGGLAVTVTGATQAYAEGPSRHCTRSAVGNIICIHKSETVYTTKDGKRVVNQKQHCSSTSRNILVLPRIGLLNQGTMSTRVGSHVECAGKKPSPKEFKEDSQSTQVRLPTAQIGPVGDLLRPLVARL